MSTPARLQRHVAKFGRLYPTAWRWVDTFRAERGTRPDVPSWPDWCFIPLRAAYAIVADTLGVERILPSPALPHVAILAALAAWRVTQGIYRFDPDLYESVISTPQTGRIPADLLTRLPEWAPYIETPGAKWLAWPVHGFFVHLEYDTKEGGMELRFLFDLVEPVPSLAPDSLMSFALHILDREDLFEGVRDSLAFAMRSLAALTDAPPETKALVREHPEPPDREVKRAAEGLAPFLALTLYLCSINTDIRGAGGEEFRREKPRPVKTKKGLRLFPAKAPIVWETGYRIGAALRRERTGPSRLEQAPAGTHASPRPHIRRAHWHTYWTGPRKDPEKRRAVLKWLPPIPVGVGRDGEDLIPTVRPLKESKGEKNT